MSKNESTGGGVVVHVKVLFPTWSKGYAKEYHMLSDINPISSKNAASGASPLQLSADLGLAMTVLMGLPSPF